MKRGATSDMSNTESVKIFLVPRNWQKGDVIAQLRVKTTLYHPNQSQNFNLAKIEMVIILHFQFTETVRHMI